VETEILQTYDGLKERVRIVHCGIFPDRFVSKQAIERIAEFRALLASRDELLITYVGRLDVEKGIDTLIEAFAVLQRRVRAKLVIVGDGDLVDTIREHIQTLNLEHLVTLHGYLMGEVLKHIFVVSDIHVCPSYYEPFGIVAAEAMAAGAAVVASDTGGLRDIISTPTVGRLFEPHNVERLTTIMLELSSDTALRKKIAIKGSKHVREHFSWKSIASKAARVYQEAIK